MRLMSHEIYAGFAKRLIQLCEEKNLPERGRQAALARMCEIKQPSVNKWFNAISLPDAANLITIADWGKTTVDWLLTGRGPQEVAPVAAPFSLVWISTEEENVLSQYRQCTEASKKLVDDTLRHAEKDVAKLRAAG